MLKKNFHYTAIIIHVSATMQLSTPKRYSYDPDTFVKTAITTLLKHQVIHLGYHVKEKELFNNIHKPILLITCVSKLLLF